MRPFLIVSGVLGGGSALVFAAAALVAAAFPSGTLVPANPWGSDMRMMRAMPAFGGPMVIDGTTGGGMDGVWVSDGGDIAFPPGVVVPGVQVDR